MTPFSLVRMKLAGYLAHINMNLKKKIKKIIKRDLPEKIHVLVFAKNVRLFGHLNFFHEFERV